MSEDDEREQNERFSYRAVIETTDGETASTLLTTFAGASGTVIVDADVTSFGADAPDSDETERIEAYFETDSPESEPEIRQRIRGVLGRSGELDWRLVDCELFTDESWKTAWKEFFEPLQLSPRIGIGPPWRKDDVPSPKDGGRIIIEPGMAFGTGNHETTRLSATMLDEMLATRHDSPNILDVGCGSAVLSMLAAKLGAGEITGIDVSEDAIDSALENLERNGLSGRIELSTTPLERVEGRWDIVVANILDHILIDLRDELFRHVGDGGRMIVSGITAERRERFVSEFVPADWRISEERRDGEWIAMALTPPTEGSAQ